MVENKNNAGIIENFKKWKDAPCKPMYRGKPETNEHNLLSQLFVYSVILFLLAMFIAAFNMIPRYSLNAICMTAVPDGYHFIRDSLAPDAISGTSVIGTTSTCTWANDTKILTVNVTFDPVADKYLFTEIKP